MGVSKSKLDVDVSVLGDVVDNFLKTCCEMNVSSSCRLDDLSLAFALYILQQRSLRRDLSSKLNEPTFYQLFPKEDALLAYNIIKWQGLAERCLIYHLTGNGIHLVLPVRMLLGLKIQQWPNSDIECCRNSFVVIKDLEGAATDYVMKPFGLFTG